MIRLLVLSIVIGTTAGFGAQKEYQTECKDSLAKGLETLEKVFNSLSETVGNERASTLRKKRSTWPEGFGKIIAKAVVDRNMKNGASNADDEGPCPVQGPNWDCNVPTDDAKRTKRSIEHKFPRLTHDYEEGVDPLAAYAEWLHGALSNSSACDGSFTDLNSITDAQINGFLGMLATRSPGAFCPLCTHMMEELHERLIKPVEMVAGKGHGVITQFLSHIPSPKTLCSAIAPGCHENFAVKATTHTDATVCASCSFCQILTNVVQHKFLLDQSAVDKLFANLQKYFFRFACSEMCCLKDEFPDNLQMDYQKCQDTAKKFYYRLIEAAKVLLRPERLCTLEMKWCELNETPNLLHCAREYCEDVADTPLLNWICTQIPDRPEEADKFLNIQGSKVYKQKADHHLEFEEKMRKKREAGEL